MRVSQVYVSNSDWLKAADLDGPVNATIVNVTMHTFDSKDEQGNVKKKDQLVLEFDGWDKKLGLNATNASRVAQLLGDETDNWTGHAITLYVDPKVKTPTGYMPAVRVMPVLPTGVSQGVPRVTAPYDAAARAKGPGPAPSVAAVQGVVNRQRRAPEPPPVEGESEYGQTPPWD